MKFSVIIPHYKTGMMTAYSISQFLKYKGKHDVNIIIVDNNDGDDSIKYLDPFLEDILIVPYPKDRMQSHGIAINFALELGYVDTSYFITAESDSFPVLDNWLDYYEDKIKKGYDCIGSLLLLSGGQFLHPTGALYKKNIWEQAKKYCDNIEYSYLPNIAMKDDFPCHLMVHNRVFDDFCKNPTKYVTLHNSYKNSTPLEIVNKVIGYEPVCGVFHNGMGQNQESLSSYGHRNVLIEPKDILLKNDEDIIYRMGSEPGQMLCYWQLAMGKKLFYVPTETKWLPNRQNQQQEYTLMENGFKHLWGVSAYNGCTAEDYQDIVKFKENQVQELYNSLPEHQKIKQ